MSCIPLFPLYRWTLAGHLESHKLLLCLSHPHHPTSMQIGSKLLVLFHRESSWDGNSPNSLNYCLGKSSLLYKAEDWGEVQSIQILQYPPQLKWMRCAVSCLAPQIWNTPMYIIHKFFFSWPYEPDEENFIMD